MKVDLCARTTYLNNKGNQVHIAGLAHRPEMEGLLVYWSIEGNHYTEDGRFVWGDSLCPALSLHSIKEEDTSEEAKTWWEGVETVAK